MIALAEQVPGVVSLEVVPLHTGVVSVNDPDPLVFIIVVRCIDRGVGDGRWFPITLVDARAICLSNFRGKI